MSSGRVRFRRPTSPTSSTWPMGRVLHRASLAWAFGVVVVLLLADRIGLVDHRTGFESYEETVRPIFVTAFGLGAILAWRWELPGGLLATFTAAGALAWQGHQLEPWSAATVVVAIGLPGFVWLLLGLRGRAPILVATGAAAAVAVAVAGFTLGTISWNDLFGPTHPDSTAELPDLTRVDWIWTGGVTATAATIVAKPAEPGVMDAAIRDRASGAVVRTVTGIPDGEIIRFVVPGLAPDTDYVVELVDRAGRSLQTVEEASFRTFPEGRADVVIAIGSCMRTGTNGAVFDAIAELEPTLFIQDGDFHYANIDDDDPDAFRDVMDLALSTPGPSNLFRSVPIAYVWDDHDYGADNADATSASRPAALSVYRQYVPSYVATAPDDPIYQAFDVGDVRVILTDVRSARDPSGRLDDADKSMLGAEQKAWLKAELLAARDTRSVTIWVSPVGWIGEATPGGDSWDGYSTERRELADFIVEHDIDRLVMLSGDAHMVAIDDGTNTGYAEAGGPSFPVLHAAALDRPGHVKGGPYSEGAIPGGGQFGLVEITHHTDGGRAEVDVRLTGRDWTGEVLLAHEVSFPLD